MNRGLADRTTSRDLILSEVQTESQTQNFSYFSHGQPLLRHSTSSTCQWRSRRPLLSSAARFEMKFFSENHSGM
jgi:hypothetical protein